MEAATSRDPAFADRPFEPLNGMAPMLSLVEDIEDESGDAHVATPAEQAQASVLRFPGGVGPRDEQSEQPSAEPDESGAPVGGEQLPMTTHAFTMPTEPSSDAPETGEQQDAPTGEQPVLVIDTDEPLATSGFDEPVEPRAARRSKPRFFGLGRRNKGKSKDGDGWFTDGPRDFNWD
jgi:hypothetical protein